MRYNYINDYLSSHMKFHIINLLKEKGFINFKDNLEGDKKINDNEITEFLKKLGVERNTEMELLLSRYNDDNLLKVIHLLDLKFDDIIYNQSLLRQFLDISRIRDNLTLKNIHDTDINKILSPYYKIELLNKVKTLVGITSIDEFDKSKFRDANKKVINDMNLLNRISMSFKLKVKPDYRLGQLFGKLLNHMLPKFTNKCRISTNGKQYKGYYVKPFIKDLLIKPDPEICFLE